MSLDHQVQGDKICRVVVDCIIEIAALYGPALVTLHYLPYCADLVDQGLRRMTLASESALISSTELILASCDCLTDKQLMDNLDDLVVDRILLPIARLIASANVIFSSSYTRKLFACKVTHMLHLLSCRLGGENVQRHLKNVLQRLFSTFSMLYDIEREDGRSVVKNGENSPSQVISCCFYFTVFFSFWIHLDLTLLNFC